VIDEVFQVIVGNIRKYFTMTKKLLNEASVPEGLSYLKLAWKQEDFCEEATDQQIPQMGIKAPQCLENIGTVLSLLERLATCFWGCGGGDHVTEYLSGRTCSLARSGLRLIKFGFYDESLLMSRSIGEIANLLFLFVNDYSSFDDWKIVSEQQRKKNYSPIQVRLKLEALKLPIPIDQQRYSRLSEMTAHVTPQTKPQNHNLIAKPTLGGYLQQTGVLLALNELAGSLGVAAACAGKLSKLNEAYKERIREESVKLLRSAGRINIKEMAQVWSELRAAIEEDFNEDTV
jgi:hypothetical protein